WFADPRVVAVALLVLQNDPARHAHGLPPLIDTAGDEYDPGGFARKRGHGTVWANGPASAGRAPGPPGPLTRGRSPGSSGSVPAASACAAFYRRGALQHAGGFPEPFRAYLEDVGLSRRLRRPGGGTAYGRARA